MNRAKLGKLKRELRGLRQSPQRAADLEKFARKLGRKKFNRGKEPVWINERLGLYPISIPHHGGKDLAPGTKNSVLNCLEQDIYAWEEEIEREELAEIERDG